MATLNSSLSTLQQLKLYSNIVADTPEYQRFAPFNPTDITTNPTNILAASKDPKFASIVDDAIKYAQETGGGDLDQQITAAYLRLLVGFGAAASTRVSGFVSTQLDPALAFDTKAMITQACTLIDMYSGLGVPKQKVMIKLPATWEGLRAARVLVDPKSHDIRCTMTLVQSITQATLACEVGATMVSPFVGRVLDWWHRYAPGKDYSGPKDPGVLLCAAIEELLRRNGYATKLMAAVRSVDECVHLAGIDAMTLNPGLLEELRTSHYRVEQRFGLHREGIENVLNTVSTPRESIYLDNEIKFRNDFFHDQTAYEKVDDGLRIFIKDAAMLKSFLREKILAAQM